MIGLLLLLFLPVAAVLHYFVHVGAIWVFVTGAIAVAVLADWVRRATEQVAAHAGPAIGGLLTVSFGSIAELLLAFFVLTASGARVVRPRSPAPSSAPACSGSVSRCWPGGLRFERQNFKRERAGLLASMLVLVVIALLLPAIFDLADRRAARRPARFADQQRGAQPGGFGGPAAALRRQPGLYARHAPGCLFVGEGRAARRSEVEPCPVACRSGRDDGRHRIRRRDRVGRSAGDRPTLGLPLLFLGVVPLALIGTSSDLWRRSPSVGRTGWAWS